MSRGAASPTGILPDGVAIASGLMAVTKAPEASGEFRMLDDAAPNSSDSDLTYLKQTRSKFQRLVALNYPQTKKYFLKLHRNITFDQRILFLSCRY